MEKKAAELAYYILCLVGEQTHSPEETLLYKLLMEFAAEIKRSAIEP